MCSTFHAELFTSAPNKTTQSQEPNGARIKGNNSLRAVVTVVVDIDSCSDPADDKRNSTSYQIEP